MLNSLRLAPALLHLHTYLYRILHTFRVYTLHTLSPSNWIPKEKETRSFIPHSNTLSFNPAKYQGHKFAHCDDYSWCASRHASGVCRRRHSVDTWSAVPCHTRTRDAFAVRGTTCRSCDIWDTRRCRVRKNSAWCRNDAGDRSSVKWPCSGYYCREL